MTSIFMANFCLNSMGMVVMDLTFISNGQIILLIDSKYQSGSTLWGVQNVKNDFTRGTTDVKLMTAKYHQIVEGIPFFNLLICTFFILFLQTSYLDFLYFRLNLYCLLDLLDFVSCFCRYLLPLSLCCAYRHQQKPCIYRWYWLSYSATPSNFLK